ncbi:patatin-like phospholipase family protein [Sphingobacterium daejeonense]|uniref:CBASS cGAMP-activated phospholipase n=1 Tax=Sphingobacterium daejeonense TaxID=371142 RepID=UPI0021A4020C|nr:CBASS cGAMP-activated phospholipase [Sphingobacterium daejeonense]MCT1531328.1 patatin-like phospholipase family protein [Sphingobacterium daejeonense]
MTSGDKNKEEKVFKILTIDGGGIKGLYSAQILKHFEEKFECRISDYFDMLCGTSTGGLIALALSLKIPAAEICNFYDNEGPKIFTNFRKIKFGGKKYSSGTVKQVCRGGKFRDTQLKKSLTGIFGDKRIADSNNLLCIPSYNITEARPFVFKFDHKEGYLNRDNKALYVDVALATSAAPTYFPMAEISYYDNKQFIDGGVWGNNPTLVGYLEALQYFVGQGKEFQKLKILSVSSLSLTGGKPTGLKRNRSFIDWKDDLFETSFSGQSFFTDFFMRKMTELQDLDVDYVRIPSSEISSSQEELVQLDVATKPALDLIRGKGNDMGDIYRKKPEIADFFKQEKHYKTK